MKLKVIPLNKFLPKNCTVVLNSFSNGLVFCISHDVIDNSTTYIFNQIVYKDLHMKWFEGSECI